VNIDREGIKVIMNVLFRISKILHCYKLKL